MIRFQKFNKSHRIATILLLCLTIIISVICDVSLLLVAVLLVWIILLMYTLNDLRNNIATFCFLISLFVFLIGREVCFEYLNLDVYYIYLTGETSFAFICLLVSMVGIILGKCLYLRRPQRTTLLSKSDFSDMRSASEAVFYFCYLFQFYAIVRQIVFVRRVGYIESYSLDTGGAGVPAIISYFGAFMPIAFCLFIATKPDKKLVRLPFILYEIYAVITLLSGRRYPFVAINLLILVYMVIRSRYERGWISRRLVITLIIIVPIMICFLGAYDTIRKGEAFRFEGILNTFVEFMDSQGGSINVIKRVSYYADDLSDLTLCSFDSTRTLLFENLIVRKLTGITVYTGNSLEHALLGHSLAHRLSYYSYGNGYLVGKGVGSCFIAELYHDFGYIGILLGSMFYGKILDKIDRISFSHPVRDGLLLAIYYFLLLAPRGGFDGFVGSVFGLYSLLGYAGVYFLSKVVKNGIKLVKS